MPYDPDIHKGRLRRLDPSFYKGHAWVHWSMTITNRSQGWLDPLHHAQLRELRLHACIRESLICPAYCLMSDHAHLLFGGLKSNSDQKNAIKFLRTVWNRLLAETGHALQEQAFDHVLTKSESKRDTFQTVANYILENPVRAERVETQTDWPYLGSVVGGYPNLHPCDQRFWDIFWKVYYKQIEE